MEYYGVYRAVVLDTSDPTHVGRVLVSVPTLGLEVWALVVLPPTAGSSASFKVGANVVVAFEGGDSSRPVVLGQLGAPSPS